MCGPTWITGSVIRNGLKLQEDCKLEMFVKF